MDQHIPFLSTLGDCELASELYSDSELMRLPADRITRLKPELPAGASLWIDPAFDAFHKPVGSIPSDSWKNFIKRFDDFDCIAEEKKVAKPDKRRVTSFVAASLDHCAEHSPAAISVPQLPLVDGASRNKANWCLAEAAHAWRSDAGYDGSFILPIIITNQRQLNRKTERTRKIKTAIRSFRESGAEGFWVVDSSLSDQDGSPTFRNKRFPGIIAFHEELNKAIPNCRLRVAGPYWGLNLVLWARGLIDNPAIGVGKAYQYHLAGGQGSPASVRIAIGPLRRWAKVSGLRKWLEKAINETAPGSDAHAAFLQIKANLPNLGTQTAARRQIASFYKSWIDELGQVDRAGRGIALYQDLSNAYVLGKTLSELPAGEKAKRPERVAEYLMLSCL